MTWVLGSLAAEAVMRFGKGMTMSNMQRAVVL